MGRGSQTEYVGSSSLASVTITRRHHPFEGKSFEVVKPGPKQIVVRLEDGSAIRIPRSWTDADGPRADAPERVFSVDALRALVALVASLGQRSLSAERASRAKHEIRVEDSNAVPG